VTSLEKKVITDRRRKRYNNRPILLLLYLAK